jgi:membrane-associated phospholipid phosphatase
VTLEAARRPAVPKPIHVPLAIAALVALAAFAVDTIAALQNPHLPFDVPLARAVQAVPWGPLLPAFGLVDWLEGTRQVVAALAAVGAVLLLNRRAAPLVAVAALSGPIYSAIAPLVARPRPPADLVHVIRHTAGYAYPSGHMVFFSWFVPLLVLTLVRPYLPRAVTAAGWLVALATLVLAGAGRIYVGEHWPSDVLGGLALGAGWTLLALSVRWLSDPALK